MDDNSNDSISKIDAAINAAKSRKGKRAGTDNDVTSNGSEPATKRPRLTDEQKAQRLAVKEQERAEKKADRIAARAARKAEQAANKPAAHLAKVAKAEAKLPVLETNAQATVNEVTTNFSRDQINAIAKHLEHFNRVQATKRALEQKINAGDKVRIVGGDSRFVGQEGVVSKAQRIRCYVEVAGAKKPIYLFTSEVELVEAAHATGTEG